MSNYEYIRALCERIDKLKLLVPPKFWERSVPFLARHFYGIKLVSLPHKLWRIVSKITKHMDPELLIHKIELLSSDKSYANFSKVNLRLLYNSNLSGHVLSGLIMFLLWQLFGWYAWKHGKEIPAPYYHSKEENNGRTV